MDSLCIHDVTKITISAEQYNNGTTWRTVSFAKVGSLDISSGIAVTFYGTDIPIEIDGTAHFKAEFLDKDLSAYVDIYRLLKIDKIIKMKVI